MCVSLCLALCLARKLQLNHLVRKTHLKEIGKANPDPQDKSFSFIFVVVVVVGNGLWYQSEMSWTQRKDEITQIYL